MRFYSLTDAAVSADVLAAEYKAGREIGCVTLGETCLFFKVKLKVSYIPYAEITRAFRRVQLIQTKMCCGRGDLQIENLVLCGPGEKELAQVQLPGAKAGEIMMEELAARGSHIQIGKPNA